VRPDVAQVCRAVVENSQRDLDFFRLNKELFASCPSISVDNAVMEKTRRGIMVPVDIGWNDVGSWSALWDYHDKT
jgi:mannose-1-phosphate guanylyltransferase